MSLTSFIKNADVRAKLRETFQKPCDPTLLRICKTPHNPALPLTNHYSLVGTAFDYLMRFHLKRLNPDAIVSPWIAEIALDIITPKTALLRKATAIIKQSQDCYTAYIKSGNITDSLIKSTLLLAQLDVIHRAGIIPDDLGYVDQKDITDLRALLNLVDRKTFKSKSVCLLNPTFGDASNLVRGADADLVLDDMIIDIKTTKYLELKRCDFNQLIGYFCLFKIGGIDGLPPHSAIRRLGIYFSRYGYLYEISANNIWAQKSFSKFLRWFQERAYSEYGCPLFIEKNSA